MQIATATEEIWQFAGYLHLLLEGDRARVAYEEMVWDARAEDWLAEFGDRDGPQATLAEIGGQPIRTALEAPEETGREPIVLPHLPTGWTPSAPTPLLPPAASDDHASFGGSGSPPPLQSGTPYGIVFVPGGDDLIAVISQKTWLVDIDIVGWSFFTQDDLPDGSVANALLEGASPLLPSFLVGGEAIGAGALLEAIVAGAHHVGDADADPSLTIGRHASGSADEDDDWSDPDMLEALAPAAPEPDEPGDEGLVIETGGNLARNDAVIVDGSEAARTMVVMGDVHELDAIVQVLGYSASTSFAGPGADDVETADTVTQSVATLTETEILSPRLDSLSAKGLAVRVETAEGDLYDFKSIFQTTYMQDGDLVSTEAFEASWSELHTGGNIQGNVAQLVDWQSYDLVIVLGDYYDINLVIQAAFIVDEDSGELGGGATAHSGGNALANHATIAHYGATDWNAMDGDLAALAAQLAAGEDPGLDAWAGIPGVADGYLDVLVVTGDFYDVNMIGQIAVIDDSDMVLAGSEEGGVFASTGSNAAVNTATIVDVGASEDQFVGGEHYEDSMLVQAELAYDGASTVLDGDTQTLATEFVAFLDVDAASASDEGVEPASTVLTGAEDGLGSMLT